MGMWDDAVLVWAVLTGAARFLPPRQRYVTEGSSKVFASYGLEIRADSLVQVAFEFKVK